MKAAAVAEAAVAVGRVGMARGWVGATRVEAPRSHTMVTKLASQLNSREILLTPPMWASHSHLRGESRPRDLLDPLGAVERSAESMRTARCLPHRR